MFPSERQELCHGYSIQQHKKMEKEFFSTIDIDILAERTKGK